MHTNLIGKILFIFNFFLIVSCQIDEPLAQEDYSKIPTSVYIGKYFNKGSGPNLPYRILYPPTFGSNNEELPLIVFLHGAGERGRNNLNQLKFASGFFKEFTKNYPAIVVFPQCKFNDWWANNSNGQVLSDGFPRFTTHNLNQTGMSTFLLEHLIDSLSSAPFVNQNRIVVGGNSMGAMGAAQLVAKFPNKFHKSFSIAGLAPVSFSNSLKQTPTWIFHGTNDTIVSSSHSIEYFNMIKGAANLNKLTLYENRGHDIWDLPFENVDLIKWLIQD